MNTKLRIFTLAALLSAFGSSAQKKTELAALPAPAGIWITAGSTPQGAAVVQRREPGREWAEVGTMTRATSRGAFIGAYNIALSRSGGTEAIPADKQGQLWDKYARSGYAADSLGMYRDNLAVRAATGTAFFDGEAIKGTMYEYRIATGDGAYSEATRPVAFPPPVDEGTVIRPVLVKPVMNGVYLEFEIEKAGDMRTANVYRSYYMRSNAERINPQVNFITRRDKTYATFTDYTATPKVGYTYTLVPVDAAGNEGRASASVKAFHVPANTIPPSVRHLAARSDEGRRAIRLSWLPPSTPDVVSVEVYRGTSFTGAYTRIASLSPTDTMFEDHDVTPIRTYYYTVSLNGAYEQSVNTPRVPGILRATDGNNIAPRSLMARTSGNVVTLTWDPSDEECRGYYVYRDNGRGGPMKKITPLIAKSEDGSGGIYRDTLPEPQSPSFWNYAVTDENASYAESPLSAAARVQLYPRSEVMIPVARNLDVIRADDGRLRIMWTNLREENGMVTGYTLYRTVRDGDGKVVEARKVISSPAINLYTDADVKEGFSYAYSVAGKLGNTEGSSTAERSYTIRLQRPLTVSNIQAFAGQGTVGLSWNAPQGGSLQKVTILRAKEGGKPAPIADLGPQDGSYTDKDVKSGERYFYYFVTQNGAGAVSEATAPVSVRVD